MNFVKLNLEQRDQSGKEASGRLRRSGYIPAVFYGPEYREALSVKINAGEFLPLIRGGYWNTMKFDVTLPNGKTEMCLIKDMDRNYVNDEILHVDFCQLVKGHKVTVRIPLEIAGKDICSGVKAGGVLAQYAHEVEIEVLPREIPDNIVIDVASLGLGKMITMADLNLPDSATIVKDPSEVVVAVSSAAGGTDATEGESEE